MRLVKSSIASVGIAVAVSLVFLGCEGPKHNMAEPKDGTKMTCRFCYDEVVKLPPHPRYYPKGKVIQERKCTACKSDVTIYDENGVTRMRCAGCAPEGVDCDKCLPPN